MQTDAGSTEADRACLGDEARWEFRAWGELHEQRRRLLEAGSAGGPEDRTDQYLVGPRRSNSLKLRDGRLEAKQLLERRHGFEQWCLAWAAEAPFSAAAARRALVDLGVEPERARHLVTDAHPPLSEASLAGIVREEAGLDWVPVTKRRRRVLLDGARAEVTEVSVRGDGRVWTVAIEGGDLTALVAFRDQLGLTGEENVPVHTRLARLAGSDDPTPEQRRP